MEGSFIYKAAFKRSSQAVGDLLSVSSLEVKKLTVVAQPVGEAERQESFDVQAIKVHLWQND